MTGGYVVAVWLCEVTTFVAEEKKLFEEENNENHIFGNKSHHKLLPSTVHLNVMIDNMIIKF